MSDSKPLLSGLVAATFTPLNSDGSLRLEQVPAVVNFVLGQGADGLFLAGSTGEGSSLTCKERMAVSEAYVDANRSRVPIVVHVGHNSLSDARRLAAHSAELGADAIAVAPPSYFRPGDVDALIACLQEIASAAPTTPLYYYHIPGITGVKLRVVDLLERAEEELPSLAGVKYSSFEFDDLLRCIRHADRRYNILFGSDEMLLAGLAMGAAGAVGSTYNFLGPYFKLVMQAFAEGRMSDAQDCQYDATCMVHAVLEHGGMNAIKAAMGHLGVDCGPPRLPVPRLSGLSQVALQRSLTATANVIASEGGLA